MKHLDQILKKTAIITAAPDDTLSSVLAKLSSSHDAAFIFDDKKQFMGVINPYYTLIKSSAYDGNTKVEHALFHPPHVHTKDSLERIVSLMNDSKIHYLPVFDEEGAFMGITSARRILAYMLTLPVADLQLGSIAHTQKGKILAVEWDDPVSKALALFQEYKTSKIVVIDAALKLKGILSHYDLIPYIVAPGKRSNRGRRGERPRFHETPVKNYAKTTVLTLTEGATVGDAIRLILSREIGSIILIDRGVYPKGIITTRDLLDTLPGGRQEKKVKITTKHLSKQHKKAVKDLTAYIHDHINEKDEYRGAEIRASEEKKNLLYQIIVHLIPEKGKMTVFKREGKDLEAMIKELKNLVRR